MRVARLLLPVCLISMLGLAACGGGGGGAAPVTPPPPTTTTTGTVSGLITDQAGRALPNVAVKIGSGSDQKSGVTNEQGFFAISGIQPGQQLINAQLAGYVENSKLLTIQASANFQAALALQAVGTTQTVDATKPNTVTHRGGNVELPANGIVDGQGAAVTSAVVQVTTMMPEDPNFVLAMPCEFIGVDSGVTTRLVSYGVLDVVLRDAAGNKLQLAAGKTAKLAFPIPAKDPADASIPLWWADPTTGVWNREGSVTRDSTARVYRGTVSHFTPWNCDQGRPLGRKIIRLKVKGVPVVGVTVRAVGDGWMAGGSTDANGEVELVVTADAPGFQSKADILMLLSTGTWVTLRKGETMPAPNSVLINDYTEVDGVVQVAGTVILRWGERPSDLDTHLTVPTPNARFHLYFGQRGRTDQSPFCGLDTDDVTSFGPEIVTISQPIAGTYRYCIHNFSGNVEHPIQESGATVTLLLANQPTRVFAVPTLNPDNKEVWAVFDLTYDSAGNPTVTEVNQLGGVELVKL